jgi:hypothetical protein
MGVSCLDFAKSLFASLSRLLKKKTKARSCSLAPEFYLVSILVGRVGGNSLPVSKEVQKQTVPIQTQTLSLHFGQQPSLYTLVARMVLLHIQSFDGAVLHEEVQRLCQQLDEKIPSAALLDMSIEDINRALGFHRIASQVVHLHEAHLLFQISKMLFTDYMLPFSTHMTSYLILSSKNAADAFRLIEVELGFMFDALYTKVITGLCWQGFLLRAISCSSSIAALLAFARMTINCHAYSTTNIVVSYCLLVGAVLHEIYSVVFLLFSDWVMLWLSKQHR